MWKTFGGRCIHATAHNVHVHQNMLYRWLTLGSHELHTLINRRYPEKPGLDYIHQLTFAVREQPGESCLLGLGGAGVAHALAPYLGPIKIDAVENNIDIINIANTYFKTDELKNMTVNHQDAQAFVKTSNTRYQHVMVDLFDAHSYPLECSTRVFFEGCKRILSSDGILALNLTNVQEQWPVFNHVRDVFSDRTVSLPVKGAANMVVLACNGPSISPLLHLLKDSQRLKKITWVSQWGCVAAIKA